MRPASYRAAIRWMVDNDDTEWAGFPPHDVRAGVSVTGALVADLFEVDEARVRADVRRGMKLPAESS